MTGSTGSSRKKSVAKTAKTAKTGKKQRIVGLVAAPGGGGFNGPKGTWRLSFGLDAWRDGQGELHTTQLRLDKTVAPKVLGSLMEQVPSHAILGFEVALTDGASGALLELLGPVRR